MCWYKMLYQVEPVVWTSFTTSCDAVKSHNRQDLIQSLVPSHYVCNKFIKHFNKNKFETNNMGRIKMNTLYNTVRETTFCAWCHVICCSTFTDVTLLFDHFQCHCSQSTTTFILEMWIVQLPEILKACPYKLECAYFAYIGVYFRILDNDTYDKVVRQMKFRATSRHSFITTVWWYNILYHKLCIREATFVNFKGKCAYC
jgi:hypothetical protein